MISREQAVVMGLLKDFRCLRVEHIEKYLQIYYGSVKTHIKPILNQLRFLGEVMLRDGLVMLPRRPVNPDILTAFDVMLEITSGKKANIFTGSSPYTLLFTVDGTKDAGFYGVAVVKSGMEYDIARQIINKRDMEMTLILILETAEQKRYFTAVKKVYFAVCDGNKYRYFNNNE